MRFLLVVPLLAVVMATAAVEPAAASYCGAASYRHCASGCSTGSVDGCRQQCHTVMKTCKAGHIRTKQFTCYKTCYDTVCEDKVVNCVKYVPETCYRTCEYTVCKPVWETKIADLHVHRVQARVGNTYTPGAIHRLQTGV